MREKIIKVPNNTKALYFSFAGLCAIVLAVAAVLYVQNSGIAARIGNQVITKEEFSKRLPKEQKAIEFAYSHNQDDLNKKLETVKKDTLEKMIEEKILDDKSRELGVFVSDSEIKAEEDKLVKAYKDKEEYERTISTAYGWDDQDVRNNIKYRLLKEKVEAKVISLRSVKGIYIRWDTTGRENEQGITVQSVEKEAAEKAKEYEEKLKSLGFDELVKLVETDRNTSKVFLGTNEYIKINKSTFPAAEDKDTIWSLKQGETSGLIKSSGGYYAIYKLTDITSGKFNDYQEFLKDAKYSLKSRVYLLEALDKKGLWEGIKTKFIGVANAGCDACAGTQGAAWVGLIYDEVTNEQLPGVTVSVAVQYSGTYGSCTSLSPSENGYCGPRSGSTLTPSDGDYRRAGYYQFGRQDGLNAFVNCRWGGTVGQLVYWGLTASKGGYITFQKNDYELSGYNGLVYNPPNIPLKPTPEPYIVLDYKTIRSESRNTNETISDWQIWRKVDAVSNTETFVFRVQARNTGNLPGRFKISDDFGNNAAYSGGSVMKKYEVTHFPAPSVTSGSTESFNTSTLWQGTLDPGATVTIDYRVKLTAAARNYFLSAIGDTSQYRVIGNIVNIYWIDGYYSAGLGIDRGGHGNLTDWEPVKVIDSNRLPTTTLIAPFSGRTFAQGSQTIATGTTCEATFTVPNRVYVCAEGNDPDSDNIAITVQYKKAGDPDTSYVTAKRMSDDTQQYTGFFPTGSRMRLYADLYAGVALQPGTTYVWRARAKDYQGEGNWTGAWSFTINTKPTAQNIAPIDGKVFTANSATSLGATDCNTVTFTPPNRVYLCAQGNDDDSGQQTALKVRYKAVGATSWTIAHRGGDGVRDFTAFDTRGLRKLLYVDNDGLEASDENRLVAGRTYVWQATVKDRYQAPNGTWYELNNRESEPYWTGSWSFTIEIPTVTLTINKTQLDGNAASFNAANTWNYRVYEYNTSTGASSLVSSPSISIGASQSSGATSVSVPQGKSYYVLEVAQSGWEEYWFDGRNYVYGNATNPFRYDSAVQVNFANIKTATLNIIKNQVREDGTTPLNTPSGTNTWSFNVTGTYTDADGSSRVYNDTFTVNIPAGSSSGTRAVTVPRNITYTVNETPLSGWTVVGTNLQSIAMDADAKTVTFGNKNSLGCSLRAIPQTGTSPLSVQLWASVTNTADFPITNFRWDLNGDGDYDDPQDYTSSPTEDIGGDDGNKNTSSISRPFTSDVTVRFTVTTSGDLSGCPGSVTINASAPNEGDPGEVAP